MTGMCEQDIIRLMGAAAQASNTQQAATQTDTQKHTHIHTGEVIIAHMQRLNIKVDQNGSRVMNMKYYAVVCRAVVSAPSSISKIFLLDVMLSSSVLMMK